MFLTFLNACVIDVRPRLMLGIWVSQIVFDVYVVVLLFLNAMDKPRVEGQKVWKMLREDGIFLIAVSLHAHSSSSLPVLLMDKTIRVHSVCILVRLSITSISNIFDSSSDGKFNPLCYK